jgi:TRAP-type mannitol/chloroaromatic compound transport system substrate-binding protein
MKKIYAIIVGIIIAAFINIAIFTAPAMAEIIKWRLVSVWPVYSSIHQSQTRLAKNIYELSDGRLQISVHPAGEIVPAPAVFDTVSKGSAEMGVDYASFWSGKNSAFDLLGSYPMMLSQYDVINWYLYSGGRDLCNYLYGKYNMIYFLNGVTSVGSGFRSRVPIKSLADFKGKKVRMAGKASGYVLQKLGAVQVSTGGVTDISQQMVSGVIDVVSIATLAIDWSLGLGDVAKYNIGPSWHAPSSCGGVMINKDAWNSLPPDLKKIIEIATTENNIVMASLAEWDNINYIYKFKEKGVEVIKFSAADLRQVEEWVWEYIVEEAKKNPDYDKIVTSMFQYLKDFKDVRDYEIPFSQGRNPSTFPKLPNLK